MSLLSTSKEGYEEEEREVSVGLRGRDDGGTGNEFKHSDAIGFEDHLIIGIMLPLITVF